MLNLQEHFGPPRSEMGKLSTAFATGGLFLFMILRDEKGRILKGSAGLYVGPKGPKCDLAERFWEKVDKNGPVQPHCPELGPCWEWRAGKDEHGYGRFFLGRKMEKAHRVAFFFQHDRWPMPLALHKCDNPACVRYDHLFEGTQKDNLADCSEKGRCCTSYPTLRGEGSPHAKLNWGIVDKIRGEERPLGTRKLARKYGVSSAVVFAVIQCKTWKPEHRPV